MTPSLAMPTDLRAPGAIDALLAFHRERFGDARMEDEGGTEGDAPADESTADEGASTEGTDDDNPEGADQLADAGKKALDAMKTQRNAERQRRRELEAEIAALKAPKPKEGEEAAPDADAIRRDAVSKANERILRSEIKAAAKGVLSDPSDAFKFLDLSEFEVGDDGEVDETDIADAIAELIKTKPYLAAQRGPRFEGSGDGGPRNTERKSQLSEADLARMSPTEIAKARREGRLDALLGKS